MLRLMFMKAALVALAVVLSLSACAGSTEPVTGAAPTPATASATPSAARYIAEAVKGCAPNDAPAVVGRLQQDVPGGTLDLTGPNGEALGETPVPPDGEGFVLRIRSMSTEPLEGSGMLRLRNQDGQVLEEQEVVLQQGEGFSLCG